MYESLIMSATKGKKMNENTITVLKSGFCQISQFEKSMNKQLDGLYKKLAEIKAENRKITSVSYELFVKVE